MLAEGTESEAEIAFLYGEGCSLFQGFYLARPIAAAEVPAAVASPLITDLRARLQAGASVRARRA